MQHACAARTATTGGPYAPGAPVPATIIHVITTGGMAGWQITLIALAAALVAATTAVFSDRTRTPAAAPLPHDAPDPRGTPAASGPGQGPGAVPAEQTRR